MRAMILAAGLGTRMQPLTGLVAKPALPVLGRPVIAWLLHYLRAHGIEEVAINLHHLPESIQEAVSRYGPPDLPVHYFHEDEPLGTGGGIAAARDFLMHSDPFIVLAGDMLIDFDLGRMIEQHRKRDALASLVLLDAPERAKVFGSIGLGPTGRVRRIAQRLDLGEESKSGLFVGVRIFSPAVFDSLDEMDMNGSFEDLTDWLGPLLARAEPQVYGEILRESDLSWTPIGTPWEYLEANLNPPPAPYLSPTSIASPGTQRLGKNRDIVVGPGARLEADAQLSRCVVWENEVVPANFHATEGVFAAGRFYPSEPGEQSDPARAAQGDSNP